MVLVQDRVCSDVIIVINIHVNDGMRKRKLEMGSRHKATSERHRELLQRIAVGKKLDYAVRIVDKSECV